MTNWDLFELCNFVLRKNGRSEPVTPERFLLMLKQENLSYFKQLVPLYSQDQKVADSLSPFEAIEDATDLNPTTTTLDVPTDYSHFVGMYYTDDDGHIRAFDLVTDEQWDRRLGSTITVPSDNYPICKIVGDNIYTKPDMGQAGTIVYLYYGVGAVGLTPTQVGLLTSVDMTSGNKKLSFSPSTQVCYFAYPATYGLLTSILDNNDFEVFGDWTQSTGTIDTLTYNIYEFNNLTTQTNFYYTFKF